MYNELPTPRDLTERSVMNSARALDAGRKIWPTVPCHESGEPDYRDPPEAALGLFTSGNGGRKRCKTLQNKQNHVNP